MRLADKRAGEFRAVLEAVAGIPFSEGNDIRTLKNGDRIFPAMLEAISGAKTRIEFLTFVYWTGDIADRFADAFCQRAQAGVEVLVMLDGYGGRQIDRRLIERMTSAGVEFRWFRPLKTVRVWKLDNRTHRKLLIIDGKIGFTGGVGIAAEWEGDARDETEWRDNHYRVEGPAVAGIRAAFFDNWAETTQTVTPLLTSLRHQEHAGDILAQPLPSSAGAGWSPIARLHEAIVFSAKERLRIATPYFAPRQAQAERLIDALRRGVEVQVIIPGDHVDKRLSEFAGAETISALLSAGAKIYRFGPSMFHTKVITADGLLTSIGSANYNMRSASKDDELVLNILDAGFTAKANQIFEEDLDRSARVQPGDWRQRGAGRRLIEAATRLFKPET